jgi:methylenetetrahydrofolate--tRNA-(uracil-5-)-methyltransferase
MILGLEHVEFIRHGEMHRNTFIDSPTLLLPTLQTRKRSDLFFAGQIAGIEGYMGNIASGVLAGINAARLIKGEQLFVPPRTTMLGALCRYITQKGERDFQPMKVNFGLLPALEGEYIKDARKRGMAYVERARAEMEACLDQDLKTAHSHYKISLNS